MKEATRDLCIKKQCSKALSLNWAQSAVSPNLVQGEGVAGYLCFNSMTVKISSITNADFNLITFFIWVHLHITPG